MSKDKAFSSCGGFMGNMTLGSAIPTLAINDEVYAINDLFVSSYLVFTGEDKSGEKEFIAIDTGNDPESLQTTLEKFQINPSQIKAVFLTHSHGDHTGGIGIFSSARIYISEAEKEFIMGQTSDEVELSPQETSSFECLQCGQMVQIHDTSIEVMDSSGHTPGSVSYLVKGKYLFAGAALNFDVYQKAEHQLYTLTEDHELLKKNNLKLAAIVNEKKIEMVFTTHGGYSAQPLQAFAGWIKSEV